MRLLTGLRAWTLQRVTALLVLGLLLWLVGAMLISPPVDYEQWRAMVARPAASAAFAILFAAVLLHAWVGVRDIVLDYVHAPPARALVLAVTAGTLSAIGVWLALALAAVHVQ
jgi:succinate dehydrogenase / fumarate reductase membrane anchor subunit